jgi:hypothetical protein
VETKTKKWKFAGSLPPVLIMSTGHYPLAGGAEPGFDISKMQLDDRILMKQVFYTTPKRIHGLLHYESPTQLFFVGYDCVLCGEVFLVPDSVNNIRSLTDAMEHGCTASPADSIAYYKHTEPKP